MPARMKLLTAQFPAVQTEESHMQTYWVKIIIIGTSCSMYLFCCGCMNKTVPSILRDEARKQI